MKYVILSVILMVLFMGAQVTVSPDQYYPIAKTDKNYANSQVDTIWYGRTAGLSGLAFAAHWQDSVNITSATVRRLIDGELMAAVTGDSLSITLTGFSNFTAGIKGTSADPSVGYVGTINMTPLCDQYRIILTYAGSNNGVTNNKVRYEFLQQFAR